MDLIALEKFDLIIIGAGTAGCLAAYSAARNGLEKIAIVDRKQKNQIGNKVCGDGIGTKHLDFLQEIGFPIKEHNVIKNALKTAHIISPDFEKKYSLPLEGQLTIINRHEFGQVLLNETLNLGVKLFDKTSFREVEIKENKAIAKFQEKGSGTLQLEAPLLVDASGINSKIRVGSGLFNSFTELKDDEQYYCYREINNIENPPELYVDSAVFEFSFDLTKGGYKWFFSRGSNEINMGTGIPKVWIEEVSPKIVYQNDMISRFNKTKLLEAGGGFVPTRHPIPSHVSNNIVLIGDAGLIVNPLHGGGLSPSLASGHIIGTIAANLVPNEELAEDDLWIFNKKIHERYGLRYSILDLYRILLQNISDEELNEALKEEYLPLGSIFYAREYELLMKLSRKLGAIWKNLPNKRFSELPKFIEKVNEVTSRYPETPETLSNYVTEYENIYSRYQSLISIRN